MSQSKPIEKQFALTIWTSAEQPGHKTFWFGRVDMKDNLRPVKIVAKNAGEAWAELEKTQEQGPCSTS